ncbi:hypothetical protein J0895_12840 [Phormidium pseudopriestleyi FRX01]|uniref:Uncharacterized protein n=1 Tax=Phormidium pseudopriestleyi FRX01 TaxID=1759528 RepID=A0ABS3FT07_9CYAN|nr:hypothetical protein [Phormidium pseudopriestleyi]MBO0349982.1 hypothetical protein [Phormidium pseudopriestleyi FRX01]
MAAVYRLYNWINSLFNTPFNCQRSIKTRTRQRWIYTDKASGRGVKAKTDFYQPDLVLGLYPEIETENINFVNNLE